MDPISNFFSELKDFSTAFTSDCRELRVAADALYSSAPGNSNSRKTVADYGSTVVQNMSDQLASMESQVKQLGEIMHKSEGISFSHMVQVCAKLYEQNEMWIRQVEKQIESRGYRRTLAFDVVESRSPSPPPTPSSGIQNRQESTRLTLKSDQDADLRSTPASPPPTKIIQSQSQLPSTPTLEEVGISAASLALLEESKNMILAGARMIEGATPSPDITTRKFRPQARMHENHVTCATPPEGKPHMTYPTHSLLATPPITNIPSASALLRNNSKQATPPESVGTVFKPYEQASTGPLDRKRKQFDVEPSIIATGKTPSTVVINNEPFESNIDDESRSKVARHSNTTSDINASRRTPTLINRRPDVTLPRQEKQQDILPITKEEYDALPELLRNQLGIEVLNQTVSLLNKFYSNPRSQPTDYITHEEFAAMLNMGAKSKPCALALINLQRILLVRKDAETGYKKK